MNETILPLLQVKDLCLSVGFAGHMVVKNVSFEVAPGEIVGIVGESGSGKTIATRAIIRLTPPAIRYAGGSISFKGTDLLGLPAAALRRIRGREIGVIFQEPMTSLNPSMTIGRQLEEGLVLHTDYPLATRREMILAMLRDVGIVDPARVFAAYPHEYSGGMRQRIMLASVMLLKPALLIADEPTTALDGIVQCEVMELMLKLTRTARTAVLLISHDLPMVARYADRVLVMQQGAIVEQGTTAAILRRPAESYTCKLLSSLPQRGPRRTIGVTEPVVSVRNLIVEYPAHRKLMRPASMKRVLHGVSLDVRPGEVVGLVGGSGSGKTTLGRAIAGLVPIAGGQILFDGRHIDVRTRDYRLNCQMVFQDPYSSLDPRMTIVASVEEGLRLLSGISPPDRRQRALRMLEEVGLSDKLAERYPHELSGGQRQRVAIARAVVRRPKFVIADEPVSALDVTVRAQILELLSDLQKSYGFSCLFISHDLGVVEQVADQVLVLEHGHIVEAGDRDAVFDHPQHPYTRRLLSAIPRLATNGAGGVQLNWRFEPQEARAI